MATVGNVLVTIEGLPAFKATAITRIGFDVQYASDGSITQITMPSFRLGLPFDLPATSLAFLDQWWQDAMTGNPQTKLVTLTVQSTISNGLTITMDASNVLGFNTLVSPSILIEPGQMRVQSQAMNISRYLDVALPPLTSPRFTFQNQQSILLHRASGGDQSLDATGLTALNLTVLAQTSSSAVDFVAFNAIGAWLDQLLESVSTSEQVITLSRIGFHGAVEGEQSVSVLPVRVNLINPLLVTDDTAPYVWDLVLRVVQ